MEILGETLMLVEFTSRVESPFRLHIFVLKYENNGIITGPSSKKGQKASHSM